jgi:hypothetical protein
MNVLNERTMLFVNERAMLFVAWTATLSAHLYKRQ